MNIYDRQIADRDILLGSLVCEDRWAAAALARGDDLALIRRVVKAGLVDALPIAIERASSRGRARVLIARASGLGAAELSPIFAALHGARVAP